MGLHFTDSGILAKWSPFVDLSTEETTQISKSIPTPDFANYSLDNDKKGRIIIDSSNNYNISSDGTLTFEYNGKKYEYQKEEYLNMSDVVIPTFSQITKVGRLEKISEILNQVNIDVKVIINPDQFSNEETGMRWENPGEIINLHNNYDTNIEEGIRNKIAFNIHSITSNLKNLLASLSSIDDVMEKFKKAKENADEKKNLQTMTEGYVPTYSSWRDGGTTISKLQTENAVGKTSIATSATGMKGFFALSYYLNDYYLKLANGGLPKVTDNEYFFREIKIGNQVYYISLLADTTASEENLQELTNRAKITAWNKLIFDKIGEEYVHSDKLRAAFVNARNGKLTQEQIETLIHLSNSRLPDEKTLEEITSRGVISVDQMNILSSMGVFADEILILADNVNRINDINIYYNNDDGSIQISGYITASTDNAKMLILDPINASGELLKLHISLAALGFDVEQITEFMTDDEVNKYVKGSEKNRILGSSKEGYPDYLKGVTPLAEEYSIFARMLKINQGMKTNLFEYIKYRYNFEDAFVNKENEMFSGEVLSSKNINKFVDIILKDKPYLYDRVIDESGSTIPGKNEIYIRNVLNNALQHKISGYKFDFNKFWEDSEYQKAAIEYYNLIKNSFNLFDAITKIPHFSEMVKAYVATGTILSDRTKRTNFVINRAEKILEEYYINFPEKAKDNADLFKKFGSNRGKIRFSEKAIQNLIAYFRDVSINTFFNTDEIIDVSKRNENYQKPQPNNIETTSVDSSNVELSDEVIIPKLANDFETKSTILKDLSFLVPKGVNYYIDGNIVESLGTNEDVIDLKSDSGIQSFKLLFETHIKNKYPGTILDELSPFMDKDMFGNEFTNLRLNINMQNLDSSLDSAKFTEALIKLKELKELKYETNKIDIDGTKVHMNLSDLLFLYNLITNKDRFGEKRLGRLFESEIMDFNTLAGEWTIFQGNIESKHWYDSLNDDYDYNPDDIHNILKQTSLGLSHNIFKTSSDRTMYLNTTIYSKNTLQREDKINALERAIKQGSIIIERICNT